MTTTLEAARYTAKAHTTGGRDGASRSSDGRLDIKLVIARAPRQRDKSGAVVRGRMVGLLHRSDGARRGSAADSSTGRHGDRRRSGLVQRRWRGTSLSAPERHRAGRRSRNSPIHC